MVERRTEPSAKRKGAWEVLPERQLGWNFVAAPAPTPPKFIDIKTPTTKL